MKLTFLGTRGGISARSSLHFMHSVLLLRFRKTALLIDWGSDWLLQKPPQVAGLLITHAHPDHVGGLAHGFPAPVYASLHTLDAIKHYPIEERVTINNQQIFTVGSMTIQPFDVYHSLRAPATGYRITAGKRTLFYVSDLIALKDEEAALHKVDLYVGDGAIITRKILMKKKDGVLTGHSPVKDQLIWCQKAAIPSAIITHCGSEIVKGDPTLITKKIAQLGLNCAVETTLAFDGMQVKL